MPPQNALSTPKTLAEAIIASHSSDEAVPGSICRVSVDFAFANDITAAPAIGEFKKWAASMSST